MQPSGIFVCALSKFSAGVQICQHQLDCRHLPFGMNIGGNSSTVITNRNGSIDTNGHFYLGAKSREVLVVQIIDYSVTKVLQPPLIGFSMDLPGPFRDRPEPFQLSVFAPV